MCTRTLWTGKIPSTLAGPVLATLAELTSNAFAEYKLRARRTVAVLLSLSLIMGASSPVPLDAAMQAESAAAPEQQAMDQLLAPVALYPDALLAQVLACATSPEQVTQVNQWLQTNSQLQGTERQQAAEEAGFDASFIALVLFPDVIDLMVKNMEWTTEVGTAFLSAQESVMDAVQRLRAQAKTVGNLETTPQQTVTTDTQGNTQVIVIQPTNPQVVYVPQYNTQTVYTEPAPPQESSSDSSGETVAAALIGFGLGVALGAAMSHNHYHYGHSGWSSWGMHWHTHTVVVRGGAWRVPPRGRYPYTRPAPGYRAPVRINAPVNINTNRQTNAYGRTPRPTTIQQSQRTTTARQQTAQPRSTANNASRGRSVSASPSTNSTASTRQRQTGAATGAFSGYGSKSSAGSASARGRSSSGRAGAARRR